MAEFDVQAAMERVENKLDTVIRDHESRISASETHIADIKEDLHSQEVKSWIQSITAALAGVAAHFGLHKIGL
jgi:hypothetical protein